MASDKSLAIALGVQKKNKKKMGKDVETAKLGAKDGTEGTMVAAEHKPAPVPMAKTSSRDMPSMHPSDLMTEDERAGAIADSIMAHRKMAKGGEVDIQGNGDESGSSPFDDMNAEAVENGEYDDSQLGPQPMDSNEMGDDGLEADKHDMIDKIRSKIKKKMGM